MGNPALCIVHSWTWSYWYVWFPVAAASSFMCAAGLILLPRDQILLIQASAALISGAEMLLKPAIITSLLVELSLPYFCSVALCCVLHLV